jgi:DNA-binding XRE family transcriptional regulator
MKFNIDLFARRLREYRSEKSQSDIAQELGINRSTISLLENGKLIPTLDVTIIYLEFQVLIENEFNLISIILNYWFRLRFFTIGT